MNTYISKEKGRDFFELEFGKRRLLFTNVSKYIYKGEQIIQDKCNKDQIFNFQTKFWRYHKIHNKANYYFYSILDITANGQRKRVQTIRQKNDMLLNPDIKEEIYFKIKTSPFKFHHIKIYFPCLHTYSFIIYFKYLLCTSHLARFQT